MKIVFNETISILECFHKALNHINDCKIKGYKTVVNLNKSAYKNRIVEYAVLYYVRNNYYTIDVVECETRAYHHGVKIGTTFMCPVGIGSIDNKTLASLIKKARLFSNIINQSYYN